MSATPIGSPATCAGVEDRLDYLGELGIRYLHLMPLLKPRAGENDGGYAVEDYDAVDPRLGTMADLERLTHAVHDRGMALCVDLVLNHTAQEHAWARKALAGDPSTRASTDSFPIGPSPTPTSGPFPRCSPTWLREASPTYPRPTSGCGRRSTSSSGTSTGPTRRCSGPCSA